MRKVDFKEQISVSGGHYHWYCLTCSYWSAARNNLSAKAWKLRHTGIYGHPTYMSDSCHESCGAIHSDMP